MSTVEIRLQDCTIINPIDRYSDGRESRVSGSLYSKKGLFYQTPYPFVKITMKEWEKVGFGDGYGGPERR